MTIFSSGMNSPLVVHGKCKASPGGQPPLIIAKRLSIAAQALLLMLLIPLQSGCAAAIAGERPSPFGDRVLRPALRLAALMGLPLPDLFRQQLT